MKVAAQALQKMQLLFVTTRSPNASGERDGGAIFTTQVLQHLAPLLTMDVLFLRGEEARLRSLTHVRSTDFLEPDSRIRDRFVRRLATGERLHDGITAALRAYDVILLQHVSSGFGLPGRIQTPRSAVVIVPMFSGVSYQRARETVPPAYLQAEVRALQSADSVLCASDGEAGDIIATYGVPQERVTRIPFGLDLCNYSFRPRLLERGCVELLCVGTVKRQKNQLEAVRVLAQLRAHAIEARLHLAGAIADTDYWRAVRALIVELELEEFVRYHGVLDPPALAMLMNRCTLSISVAEWETFGIAIFESLAVGLPVVAYADLSCVWEYAQIDGALVGVQRQDGAMAARIAAIVSDPRYYARLSAVAALGVCSMDERTVMRAVFNHLTDLVKRPPFSKSSTVPL